MYCMLCIDIQWKYDNLKNKMSFTSIVAPIQVASTVFTFIILHRASKCFTCGEIDNTMQGLQLTIRLCVSLSSVVIAVYSLFAHISISGPLHARINYANTVV